MVSSKDMMVSSKTSWPQAHFNKDVNASDLFKAVEIMLICCSLESRALGASGRSGCNPPLPIRGILGSDLMYGCVQETHAGSVTRMSGTLLAALCPKFGATWLYAH